MSQSVAALIGPIPPDPIFDAEANRKSLSSARSDYSVCEGPSKISGPIPSDYGFENEREKNTKILLDFSKNPKVRGDGMSNFLAHKQGTGLYFLVNSQERPFSQSFKRRKQPKNYIASNTVKIKEIMRRTKEREAQKEKMQQEKNQPVKALHNADKFSHVESKLKSLLLADAMAGEKKPIRPHTARESASSLKLELENRSKDDIDFVKRNQQLATQMKIKRAPSVEMLKNLQDKTTKDLETYLSQKNGKVPQYIKKRKEDIEKAQVEFIKSLPDPDQPPGHRKLPDDERIATLNQLKETHKKMMSEMNSLPIRDDTLRLKTIKSDLEKRLAEVEEAIKIFSKPKVFVKINS